MPKYSGRILLVSLLLPLFLIAGNSVKVYEISFHKHNPRDTEYPGGRGPNQFIVYTPEFGERTGTNEWGIEAVISDGRIITQGGNNHRIPEDGFVLSAHGSETVWISALAREGRKVEVDFDKKIITILYDQMARLNNSREQLQELQQYREENKEYYGWISSFRQQRFIKRINRKINRMGRKIERSPETTIGRDFFELEIMIDEARDRIKDDEGK